MCRGDRNSLSTGIKREGIGAGVSARAQSRNRNMVGGFYIGSVYTSTGRAGQKEMLCERVPVAAAQRSGTLHPECRPCGAHRTDT